jgi:DNA primase
MKIKNYEEVVSQLRAKLPEYLAEKIGYQEGKNFKCLNPNHQDKHPSCGMMPDKDAFHCFSCGMIGSIFDACKIIEGKPASGPGFIQDNLLYLAKKYNIQVESAQLTEEEMYELDTYRAYKAASDFIAYGPRNAEFEAAVKERGWSDEILKEFGVGCIPDFATFKEQMKTVGYPVKFMDDVDLTRAEIFGSDRLIFTIKDEHGRPVGFASRNLSYTEDKEHGAKYVNQKHTGNKCNIYRKSERLFGLDNLLKHRKKNDKSVYIFEGYSDVLTAAQAGVHNCVAVGGLTLTIEQVQLLKQHNLYEIYVCLDGDDKGQGRTAVLLDTVLCNQRDLNVSVFTLPPDMDPDDFIRAKGIKEFKKMKKRSAFEWRLAQFGDDASGSDISKAMVPLIVNESSIVDCHLQCEVLAKRVNAPLRSIQGEVDRLKNNKEGEKLRERDLILEQMSTQISKDRDNADFIIQNVQAQLFELDKRYNEDSFSEDATLAVLDGQKNYEEAKDGKFSGFVLGPHLKGLQEVLCGEWKKDVWLCLPGKPNSGKTSLACKLAYEIARHKVENNAVVIYHSIDDTAIQIMPKFVCMAEGSRKITLNEVSDPNYWSSLLDTDEKKRELYDRRETGYSVVRDLIKDGRLIIKDTNDGSSIPYAERLIKYYKNKYPDRNIVYILDNFHKQKDFQAAAKSDERVRFKTISNIIKNLATANHCCVITTVEYKKVERGRKATNEDMAETGQIEYDANFVAHVRNEVHERGDQATLAFVGDVSGKPTRMPIIELDIGKNKITSFKNRIYFNFYPSSSDFEGVPEKTIVALLQKQEEKTVKEDESILGK